MTQSEERLIYTQQAVLQLEGIIQAWSNIDREELLADFVKAYPEAQADEAEKGVQEFADHQEDLLAGAQAFIDFLRSEEYSKVCDIFPDLPWWMVTTASNDPRYLWDGSIISFSLEKWLPNMKKALLEHDPSWTPGSISIKEIVPDYSPDRESARPLIKRLTELSIASIEKKSIAYEVGYLANQHFSTTSIFPTGRQFYEAFRKDFMGRATASAQRLPETGGLVPILVKNNKRSKESVYMLVEPGVTPPDVDFLLRNLMSAIFSQYHYCLSTGQADENGAVIMSIDSIYRAYHGDETLIADAEKKKLIIRGLHSLLTQMFLFLNQDEVERIAGDGTITHIKDAYQMRPMLQGSIQGATVNGQEITYLKLTEPPMLYEESIAGRYTISLPSSAIARKRLDRKGNPTNSLPITERRAAINIALASRIQGINGGFKVRTRRYSKKPKSERYGLTSTEINLENFFDGLCIPYAGSSSSVRQDVRKEVIDQLKYLEQIKFIDGWKWLPLSSSEKELGKRGKNRIEIIPQGFYEWKKKQEEKEAQKEAREKKKQEKEAAENQAAKE